MEPEFGAGIGQDASRQRPRPTALMRVMELVGLALVLYATATYHLLFLVTGAVLILGSYKLYRRKADGFSPQDSGRDMTDISDE
jgi:hypothetical protein